MTTTQTTDTRKCQCGARLEPKVLKSRAGKDVMWVCPNQWAEGEHGE